MPHRPSANIHAMSKRYLFGWEIGGGLGHAGRLKPLAQGLHARGHAVALGLRDLVQTRKLLQDLPLPRLQAPVWLHQVHGLPKTPVSLAEVLMGQGYIQADAIDGLVQGWLSLIELSRANALLADYAPSALIAARIAGIASASIGIGFWMPPNRRPVPAFRDWEPIEPGRVERSEALVLEQVNEVLRRHGSPPYAQLGDLFGGDMPLLCSWPEIDHFDRGDDGNEWLGPNFLPAAGQPPDWPQGDGPRVFAYLKSGHPDHAAALKALVDLGARVLCWLPEVAAGKAPPLQSARLRYASAPVDLGAVCATARLVLCHAGQATLVQASLAGTPTLLLPMHAEQFLMARQVDRSGLGINVAQRPRPTDFRALAAALLAEDAPQRLAAQAFAQRYRGFSHAGQVEQLLDRLQALPDAPRRV